MLLFFFLFFPFFFLLVHAQVFAFVSPAYARSHIARFFTVVWHERVATVLTRDAENVSIVRFDVGFSFLFFFP